MPPPPSLQNIHKELASDLGVAQPSSGDLTPWAERGVLLLVEDGKAIVRFPGEDDTAVTAGDILIIPHGDAHTVSNGSPSTYLDSGASLGEFLVGHLTSMRLGGGGDIVREVINDEASTLGWERDANLGKETDKGGRDRGGRRLR